MHKSIINQIEPPQPIHPPFCIATR